MNSFSKWGIAFLLVAMSLPSFAKHSSGDTWPIPLPYEKYRGDDPWPLSDACPYPFTEMAGVYRTTNSPETMFVEVAIVGPQLSTGSRTFDIRLYNSERDLIAAGGGSAKPGGRKVYAAIATLGARPVRYWAELRTFHRPNTNCYQGDIIRALSLDPWAAGKGALALHYELERVSLVIQRGVPQR